MTRAKLACAWIIIGATIAGAIWLYTYRVAVTVEYIEYIGRIPHHFHPSEQVREQPWWSVYATVALIVIGGASVAYLVPRPRRLITGLTGSRLLSPPGS